MQCYITILHRNYYLYYIDCISAIKLALSILFAFYRLFSIQSNGFFIIHKSTDLLLLS